MSNLYFIKVRGWPKRTDFSEVAETTLPLLQNIKSLLKHREALRGLEEKFSWMF